MELDNRWSPRSNNRAAVSSGIEPSIFSAMGHPSGREPTKSPFPIESLENASGDGVAGRLLE